MNNHSALGMCQGTKWEETATKKSACPVNVVTTDIIKGSLFEFLHRRGEIEDNHPGREEIIKTWPEGAKAQ